MEDFEFEDWYEDEQYMPDDFEGDDWWDWDEDEGLETGFDPYLGCYTYDC